MNPYVGYRGLLLDFGSVISKSFFETRREFEQLLGLPGGSLDWSGPFDPRGDDIWQSMLAGKISERDYWRIRAEEVGALLSQRWTIQDFCLRQNDLPFEVALRPEADRLVRDARHAGMKLGILTNELELFHGADWIHRIPLMKHFDVIVDATHTGILKPDPRAYYLALDALGLRPEEIVFLDDQVRNVRGGEAVGIRSVHLSILEPALAFDEARSLLGLGGEPSHTLETIQ